MRRHGRLGRCLRLQATALEFLRAIDYISSGLRKTQPMITPPIAPSQRRSRLRGCGAAPLDDPGSRRAWRDRRRRQPPGARARGTPGNGALRARHQGTGADAGGRGPVPVRRRSPRPARLRHGRPAQGARPGASPSASTASSPPGCSCPCGRSSRKTFRKLEVDLHTSSDPLELLPSRYDAVIAVDEARPRKACSCGRSCPSSQLPFAPPPCCGRAR